MLTQMRRQLKAPMYVDLYMAACGNIHPGLTLPFFSIREAGEGCWPANHSFILALPPANALISPPQPSKISHPPPGETEIQGEPEAVLRGADAVFQPLRALPGNNLALHHQCPVMGATCALSLPGHGHHIAHCPSAAPGEGQELNAWRQWSCPSTAPGSLLPYPSLRQRSEIKAGFVRFNKSWRGRASCCQGLAG